MSKKSALFDKHGGYRQLHSFTFHQIQYNLCYMFVERQTLKRRNRPPHLTGGNPTPDLTVRSPMVSTHSLLKYLYHNLFVH